MPFATPGSADVPVGMRDGAKAGGDAGAPGGTLPRSWYSRGYLPHRDEPHLLQSITYRLADSLPQEKLRQLEDELRALPDDVRESARRKTIERWLDAGMGCAVLGHPEVARYVQDSLLHFHGERYRLHAWCVMPNHVHVLIQPRADLASIVQGWKSFTARWVLRNRAALGLRVPAVGHLWMREYWDRYIRDENHYRKTVEYIHQNPVSAGLCATPEAWPWSSASGTFTKADGDVGAPG